jgi:membrane protease YdiL (CAAX protease family)
MVVFSVHSVNTLLGYACFSWPLTLPSLSLGTLAALNAYGNMFFLMVRNLLTATGVSLVEELLFRSWLEEEITVDHGYYQAVVLSAIAFSVIHRYGFSLMIEFLKDIGCWCNNYSRMCEFKSNQALIIIGFPTLLSCLALKCWML